MLHPILFTRDQLGRSRIWRIEQDGGSYRTIQGLQRGAKVQTGWIHCSGKQGRDEHAQAESEIASAYRRRLSRGYERTERAAAARPGFRPMLAGKYLGFEEGYAQPKLDGIRCIARSEGLFTRQGQPIAGVPHIFEALAGVFAQDPETILDGELYNHCLRGDFGAILSMVQGKAPKPVPRHRTAHLIEYHVYDIPSENALFSERISALQNKLGGLDGIIPVETHRVQDEAHYDQLHEAFLAFGYEGSMWRADTHYEHKRSKALLKRKDAEDAEFPCIAIEPGSGSWAGMAKCVLCQMPDGRTFGAGIRGHRARAKELLHEHHEVVTVRYFGLTRNGTPRFPVVTKFWGAQKI